MTQAYEGRALRRAALYRVLRRAATDRALEQAALRRALQRNAVGGATTAAHPDADVPAGGAQCR